MNLEEYSSYDALGLAELVSKGEVTAEELCLLATEGANAVNGSINALAGMLGEPVSSAPASDARFEGVPTFLKDLGASIAGVPQEMGSRFTAGMVAPLTTYFAQQMLDAGFNVIGRTTTPEFGLTLTTETLACGKTCNPWNLSKIVGGSSGGSAAMVAAGVVPLAHTNDGGGSTRIPASICGNVGLKSSRGRVSLGPMMNDVSAALVNEGCNSRTVRDSAAFLDAVSHPQPGEGNLMTRAESFLAGLENGKPGSYRIALSLDPWGGPEVDGDVRQEAERVAQLLRDHGHVVEEATPDILKTGMVTEQFQILWFALAELTIAQLSQVTNRAPDADHLENLTLQMVERGKQVTALQFATAMGAANAVSRELGTFFDSWDLMLTPTLDAQTPDLDSNLRLHADVSLDDWYSEALGVVPKTPLANYTGVPAISVPCGIGPGNMPLGMQFYGPMGTEARLLDIARQLEIADPWVNRRPGVHVAA